MQHLVTSVSLLAILAPSVAAQSLLTYGTGTKGSNGKAPTLWASTTARPGASTFAFVYEKGLANANALTVIAGSKANVTVGGLTFLVDLATGIIAPAIKLDSQGKGVLAVPIPNTASIIGLVFHNQGFVADATASVFGLSATSGLSLRLARSGMVVTQTSAIDLASGRVAKLSAPQGYAGNFVPTGDSHVILIGTKNTASLYDASTYPPKFVKTAKTTSPGFLQTMAVHPNGQMMYAVANSHVSLSPFIDVLWSIPALFGTLHPAPKIYLGKYKDAVEMVCHPDGKIAYLGSLGLVSGPGAITRIDIDPNSSTFHKKLPGSVTFSGRFIWGVDISRDGRFVFAAMGPLSGFHEVAVIDTTTFKAIDFDPVSSGQQNLGGETSLPRTKIPVHLRNVRVGPRGEFLYFAHAKGIVSRLDYRSSAPTYRQIVSLQTPSTLTNSRGLEVSDAGDRLYFDAGNVYELDPTTMKITRTWRGAGGGWHLTVR
jgi:hypothetical protein